MALDHVRRIAADGDALDHVGVKRALGEKAIPAVLVAPFGSILGEQFLRRVLETP